MEWISKMHNGEKKEKERGGGECGRNNEYTYLYHNRVIYQSCCFSFHYRACSMCTSSKCDAA